MLVFRLTGVNLKFEIKIETSGILRYIKGLNIKYVKIFVKSCNLNRFIAMTEESAPRQYIKNFELMFYKPDIKCIALFKTFWNIMYQKK